MRCSRCGRRLLRPSASGFGPVCERAVLGSKPKRRQRKHHPADTHTADLFAREKDITTTVHALIGRVSLEMPS